MTASSPLITLISCSIGKSSRRGFASGVITASGKQHQDECHVLHTEGFFASFHNMQQLNEGWDQIGGFQVDLAGTLLSGPFRARGRNPAL